MRYNTKGASNVLVISDMQVPFEHRDAYRFLCEVDSEYECDTYVCIGDEVDQHALSTFDPHPEADGPGVELRKSIRKMQRYYERFPDMMVCHSNHTRRVYKKLAFANIPKAYFKEVAEWMEAPEGWVWENEFVIDGVRYEHGDAHGGEYAAKHACKTNRQSTVIGHHHSHAGIAWTANHTDAIFGMNVGCLIDNNALAFTYGRMFKFKPTLGCGVVIKGIPQFIPMKTTKAGRWTGDL
jgi:hypothetical protein